MSQALSSRANYHQKRNRSRNVYSNFILHATRNLLKNKEILNETLMNQTIYKKPDMYIRPAYNNQSLYDYFMENHQDWLWVKKKELIKENY